MKKLIRGRALYTEKDRIWVARGLTFFAVDYDGNRVTRKYTVGGTVSKILSCNRLSRQLLRQGIHHLVPLGNGDLFLTVKRKAYTVSAEGKIKSVFTGYIGNKPAHQGICVTPKGTVFFGEYSVNLDHRNETRLYRSTDGAMHFSPVLTFPKNIRHIHFVKYDPFEDCIWLGTGDEDAECFLMRSTDEGDTWETVGSGSQDWRAIGVCFAPECLIWGTDAGSVPDQNHIIRMDRKTRALTVIADAEGPCHGCGSTRDGRVFISTGVEGGENEKDRYARLKQVCGQSVRDLWKRKKDLFPLILQYGVMRFPLGTENTDNVLFTCMALRRHGEQVMLLQDDDWEQEK